MNGKNLSKSTKQLKTKIENAFLRRVIIDAINELENFKNLKQLKFNMTVVHTQKFCMLINNGNYMDDN